MTNKNIFHLLVKGNKGKALCGQDIRNANLSFSADLRDVTCETCRKAFKAMSRKERERNTITRKDMEEQARVISKKYAGKANIIGIDEDESVSTTRIVPSDIPPDVLRFCNSASRMMKNLPDKDKKILEKASRGEDIDEKVKDRLRASLIAKMKKQYPNANYI